MRDRIGVLSQPDFRRLWIGQAVSAAGDGLTGVALTFAVLLIHGSATDLGIVVAAFLVPRVAFMLIGGVWADRLPRRRVMIASDLVQAGAQLAIAAALFSGTQELLPFVIAAAVGGGASAFFQPAIVGLIPQTVAPERLQDANALLSLSRWAARLGGPVLAGLAVAAGVLAPLFVVDALSFAFSALMLSRLTIAGAAGGARQRFLDDFKDGWREVLNRRWLVASLAAFAFANLAFSGFFIIGPVIVQRDMGGAPDWGVLMALFAIGGFVGAAAAMRLRPARPLVAAFTIFLGVPLLLVLLSASPPFALLAIGCFIGAAATELTDTIWHTTLQQQIPDQHLSRVSSVDWTVSLVMTPLGAVLAGPLAAAVGEQGALITLALLAGVPLLLVSLTPSVRAIRGLTTTESTTTEEPVVIGERELREAA